MHHPPTLTTIHARVATTTSSPNESRRLLQKKRRKWLLPRRARPSSTILCLVVALVCVRLVSHHNTTRTTIDTTTPHRPPPVLSLSTQPGCDPDVFLQSQHTYGHNTTTNPTPPNSDHDDPFVVFVPTHHPVPHVCGTLWTHGHRRQWNQQQPLSPLAQELHNQLFPAATTRTTNVIGDRKSACEHIDPTTGSSSTTTSSNSSQPHLFFHLDNSFGMGSHIHLWSQALCNAHGAVVHTVRPAWIWRDAQRCADTTNNPWECYFPHMVLPPPPVPNHCPQDTSTTSTTTTKTTTHAPSPATTAAAAASNTNNEVPDPRNPRLRCPRLRQHNNNKAIWAYRAAATELLFRSVSPLVLAEASRQWGWLLEQVQQQQQHDEVVFVDDHPQHDVLLITVHMRWGDKFWEMDLPAVEEYIHAVERSIAIVQQQRRNTTRARLHNNNNDIDDDDDDDDTASILIYLATEDPRAAEAFTAAAVQQKHTWTVLVDVAVTELAPARPTRGNRASAAARHTRGRAGLNTVASILVALQADAYVLTTQSNWSRLLAYLLPKDDTAVHVEDLRPGVW